MTEVKNLSFSLIAADLEKGHSARLRGQRDGRRTGRTTRRRSSPAWLSGFGPQRLPAPLKPAPGRQTDGGTNVASLRAAASSAGRRCATPDPPVPAAPDRAGHDGWPGRDPADGDVPGLRAGVASPRGALARRSVSALEWRGGDDRNGARLPAPRPRVRRPAGVRGRCRLQAEPARRASQSSVQGGKTPQGPEFLAGRAVPARRASPLSASEAGARLPVRRQGWHGASHAERSLPTSP